MELRVSITAKGAMFDGKASEVATNEIASAIYEAAALMEREVKLRTPQGVGGLKGSGLRSTIHGEVSGKGTPLVKGEIGHQSKYGDVIEKGRRPGQKAPPEGSLIRWMEVKLGMDSETARRMEFVIRRKIGQKGFPGAKMFEKALAENWSRLEGIFDRHGFEIARVLNGE